jgi:hypothetical protein
VILALVGLANAWVLGSSNLIDDDAFVFFRFVDHMLDGHGLTWNPGETPRVEGYTSFLFTMVVLVPRSLGADPVVTVHLMGIGFYLATIFAALGLTIIATGRRHLAVLVAPLLLATSAQYGGWARDGMETCLFGLLIVLSLMALLRQSQPAVWRIFTGVLFGLTTLARPEGGLIFAVVGLWMVWQNRAAGRALVGKAEVLLVVGALIVLLPHEIWRYAYYGELLPNTYYAKVGFTPGQIPRGLRGLLGFLASFQGLVTMLAVAGCALSRRNHVHQLYVWLLAAWIFYFTISLGLPRWQMTYTMPITLLAYLALGSAAVDWAERGLEAMRTREAKAVFVGALALALAGNLGPALARPLTTGSLSFRLINPPDRSIVNSFIAIGQVLGRMAEPGETVAVGACGAIPYYSGLVTYDVLGLTDKHIARLPMPKKRTDAFGHEKGDGAYILSKQPTYMIPLPLLTPRPNAGQAGFERSFIEIFNMPEFRRDYEFQNVQLENGLFFNYYKRKLTVPPEGGA